MKHVKSERLKKLETELHDLEEWLRLGLVPKKDIQKHKEEIASVQNKIAEEKERLQFLKESGEIEEYVTPKKTPGRTASYTDMPTIPDIEMGETAMTASEGFDLETQSMGFESSSYSYSGDEREEEEEERTEREEENEEEEEEEEEESYFSEKNRWKRGGIIDPDADEW